MRCLVCEGVTEHFFEKRFDTLGLGVCTYEKCTRCGFVASRTHLEMTEADWSLLNARYHTAYQGSSGNPDDPRWVERLDRQAGVLAELAAAGVLDRSRDWLDYGSGDGKLAEGIETYGGRVTRYEPLSKGPGCVSAETVHTMAPWNTVISTSVFEHVRSPSTWSDVLELVADDGALALHTLVCEKIPSDPNWFYLLPVHCAFHTNASMEILFRRHRFSCSTYHPDSRLWLWFRRDPVKVRSDLALVDPTGQRYVFAERFVDFWK